MVAPWVCVTIGDLVALAQDRDIPAHPMVVFRPHCTWVCPYQAFIWPSRLMNNPLIHQQSEPLPVSYLPIRHTEGAENKEGFVVFSVPHRLKWLRGFSNEAVWLLKADLSPFCFPSHP